MGRIIRFAQNMTVIRRVTPRINDEAFASFSDFMRRLWMKAIPSIVENSARAFIDAPIRSPLRVRIARKATAEVVAPGVKPKSSSESTIGMPVKSNFRYGSQGNGIFRWENFME